MAKSLLRARLGATLAGILLAGGSTAALAAPTATDARLAGMQQQLDSLRAELAALRAAGQGDDPQIGAFQAQLDGFARQLADLKAAQGAAAGDIATLKAPPAGSSVKASLPNGKPALASADGRFTANIRAILMMDAGKYFQGDPSPTTAARDLNEGANFRRARIGFDGRLFKDFDYAIVYEFGGSGAEEAGRLYEASLTYTALAPWRIKVGAYEPNIGLAAATSTSAMPLMERPAPAEVARGVAAGDSRVAVQLTGSGTLGKADTGIGARWLASTAFTGNAISSTQAFDEQTAWIGRLAVAPFAGDAWQGHLGLNYQYVIQPNDETGGAAPRYPVRLRDRPELRLDGTRLVDTGAIDADHAQVLGLEGAFQVRNLLLEGEGFRYRIARRASILPDPRFSGWYLQGSWVLTGEPRAYDAAEGRFAAPRQKVNFSPAEGAWGAFELAARYSMLDLNFNEGLNGVASPAGAVRGGKQKIMTVGLNWYLNPALRLMFDVQKVDIDRLNAAGAQIGQEYEAVAMRGQLTF